MQNLCLKTATFLIFAGLATQTAWAEGNQSPPALPDAQTAPAPQVSRSAFTTGINAHEPADQLARISAGQEIHYFTELTGLQGRVVTHRWEKDGAFQLGLQFPVGGQRWRVHSSKNITSNLPGIWTVTVQNDDGAILKQETLIVDPVLPTEQAAPVMPALSQPAPKAVPETPQDIPERAPTPAKESPASASTPAKSPAPIWDTLPH